MPPISRPPCTLALPALTLGLLAACAGGRDRLAAPRVEALPNPAPAASAQPGVTVSPAGAVILSWEERQADSSFTLHYAQLDSSAQGGWSPVGHVQTGTNVLGSATDVPSIIRLANGTLVASWRGKHGAHGYDILTAHSADGGTTWSAPVSPHRDTTTMEHGFVSWLQLGDSTGLVWVDGRANADPDTAQHATRLAHASLDSAGAVLPEHFIDLRICDCCHTSAAAVPGGAVVAYRDRHEGEIRDISTVRWSAGGWREPVPVHADGWHYAGCPVNGPSIAAVGAKVAVAWFTSAHDTARVRVAFSADTATTFGTPVEVNEGKPDGKVGLVMLPIGEVIVSWIERRGAAAILRVRRVAPDGTRSPAVDVATFGEGKRAGGMPRMAQGGGSAILGWTDPATDRIRTARIRLP